MSRSRKPFILGSYLAPRTPIPSAQTVSPQMSPSTRGPSGSSTASTSTRPLNGVFGLHKPSGPTSMSLLDELKPLFASSSLFRNADGSVPADLKGKGKWRGKGRGKGKGRSMDEGVPPKIGQGGTLDPLADGVLGESACRMFTYIWSMYWGGNAPTGVADREHASQRSSLPLFLPFMRGKAH